MSGRCDSFVVETEVHYPTDITLLWDALRKVITLSARRTRREGLLGWGQWRHNLRQVKGELRRVQKLKHSTSQDEGKQAQREKALHKAYRRYLALAHSFMQRAEETLEKQPVGQARAEQEVIERFLAHARRQIDQIQRRVLEGETIPHSEKVFSLFEEHTEWISKGKAGVPVELGLNVAIMEDQYGFILHHRVLHGQRDEGVAVPMVEETQARYPDLKRCSFDANFYTPDNRQQLDALLALCVLPSKGHPSPDESTDEFERYRRRHAAVESAINALEVHGLDRCPDQGIDGFTRYVALAVVARNIQQIGVLIQKRKAAAYKRQHRRKRAA